MYIMEYIVSESQINKMKHAIGFQKDRIKGRKHLKYEAFRNHYVTREGCHGFDKLVDLVDKGLMTMRQDGSLGYIFHVSKDGFNYLSEITGVTITELDDSE